MEQQANSVSNEVIKGIINRRSVYPRQFSGAVIPKEDIMAALEAANWAPTHKKTQPWNFHIFHGQSKENLVDFWVRQAMESAFAKGEHWDESKEQKFELFRSKASHIIAIVCRYSGQVPEIEETCATACAVQNLWISLSSLGHAGYWSTGNGAFSPDNHKFHNLRDDEKLIGYFIAGVPVPPIAASMRKPVEEHVFWEES